MGNAYLLSIDEGTTNTKAILVDRSGKIVAKASEPVNLTHPHPGWAEQDPEQIWLATLAAIEHCVAAVDHSEIAGVAISNQRESVLLWERATGKALTPLVSWQCRRSEPLCRDIIDSNQVDFVAAATGAAIDPLFPASKIKWLLNAIPDGYQRAQRGEICAGTMDCWLAWKLTNGAVFVTDVSNASRYQLFNIHDFVWDSALLSLFGIPKECLPEVLPSSGDRGKVKLDCLDNMVPLLSQAGDSHAALYGQGGFRAGIVKATYGTGSSLMTMTSSLTNQNNGICSTVAWGDGKDNRWALEGNITHSGAAIQYAAKLLGIKDIESFSELAWSVDSSEGAVFVPALAGLGAPHWVPDARAIFCGITDATERAHIARAAFEAVTYQVADVFFAMQDSVGAPLNALYVDGGPTRNKALMQLQADLIQKPIYCRDVAELSALGAAFLAGRAIGWWPDDDTLEALLPKAEVILPNPNNKQDNNYQIWKHAVKRACFQTQ